MVSRAAVWSAAEVEIPCREHYLVLCAARLRIPCRGRGGNVGEYPYLSMDEPEAEGPNNCKRLDFRGQGEGTRRDRVALGAHLPRHAN